MFKKLTATAAIAVAAAFGVAGIANAATPQSGRDHSASSHTHLTARDHGDSGDSPSDDGFGDSDLDSNSDPDLDPGSDSDNRFSGNDTNSDTIPPPPNKTGLESLFGSLLGV